MLDCRYCLRRCLRALLSTYSPATSSTTTIRHTALSNFQQSSPFHANGARRQHVATTTAVDRISSWDDVQNHQSSDYSEEDNKHIPVPVPRNWSQQRALELKASRNTKQRDPKRLDQKFLQTELKYLRDPIKLAEHVKHVLDNNDEEKAQALIRLSSKAVANTVSWNHLINWQMQHGKTRAAFETYNDMKKRAQRPDNYTYTILLRGLADYAHHPQSLGKALSIYHGMSAPNAKVSPNITHVNAVINVCARANDTNSMWDIVSKLPERGPLAADCWTFSTIFNHMRFRALNSQPSADETEDDIREAAVVKGRQMWSIIIARWRKGDMKIDEQLVCSMGRLLLIGQKAQDWDDVLSLVSQTTEIPRLLPRYEVIDQGSTVADTDSKSKGGVSPSIALASPEHVRGEPSRGSEFDFVDIRSTSSMTRRRGFVGSPFYVRPGNLTLALIMDALYRLNKKAAALKYWAELTDRESWNIVPDNGSVSTYLRVLRVARASTDALKVLENDLPRWKLAPIPGMLKIAMRTCLRDKLNPRSMENATALLDIMSRNFPEPDLEVLDIFLQLASSNTRIDILCRTLDTLDPVIVNLRSIINFGHVSRYNTGITTGSVSGDSKSIRRKDAPPTKPSSTTTKSQPVSSSEFWAGLKAMQSAISIYDKVLRPQSETHLTGSRTDTGAELSPEKRALYTERRSRLASFVSRCKSRAPSTTTDHQGEGGGKGEGEREGEGESGAQIEDALPQRPNWGPGSRSEPRSVHGRTYEKRNIGALKYVPVLGRGSRTIISNRNYQNQRDQVQMEESPSSSSFSTHDTPKPNPADSRRQKGPPFNFDGDRIWKKERKSPNPGPGLASRQGHAAKSGEEL